jgi:hypothetical protein
VENHWGPLSDDMQLLLGDKYKCPLKKSQLNEFAKRFSDYIR